jgi:hypothetical protein
MKMETIFHQRARSIWNVGRIFSRMVVEHVAAVWLLGIAPFLAHLATASPKQGYRWVPNDLYLFVMVIGGACAMEAFKDRESEGPLRAIAGVTGFVCVIGGAWAYGSLEAGTALNGLLRDKVVTAIGILLGIDLFYRIPKILGDAMQENARRKGV